MSNEVFIFKMKKFSRDTLEKCIYLDTKYEFLSDNALKFFIE
jgi:hypothetical protein